MPILSNLSRRFHMLTTDAKPDPPRIPVKGYTHNLNPNTDKEETKKTKLEAAPIAPERSSVASPERKEESVLNGAESTANSIYSTIQQDPYNPNTFADDAKQRSKPNIRTKTKSKQHKYSRGTHIVNYNIVNSNGVKIGSRTSYICNVNQFTSSNGESSEEAWSKSEPRRMPLEVERSCACTDEITLDDIFIIKTYIGRGWKDVARKLLYAEGQIEQFEENYKYKGISEVVYQIFLDWKQANTKDAEIGNLINVLWACKEYDCAERLAPARKNSA